MRETEHRFPRIPAAPRSIQKGVPLKNLLGPEAVECLASNVALVYSDFDVESFRESSLCDLETLELMQRGEHIATALRQHLPALYRDAAGVLLDSLTPERTDADEFGLAAFFYLPHSAFIANYGTDSQHNGGSDPFEASMSALYALTTRFTSEFAIRNFLIRNPERTLDRVMEWTADRNQHVRRLCSEGTRPRLPWGKKVAAISANPQLTLPVLEVLKNDPSLYVRRSVANHLGDIAKEHADVVFERCESWLRDGADAELRWVIRHALRYPARKGSAVALKIQRAAEVR